MNNLNSIEDCLELIVYSEDMVIEKSDYNIMTSIARQIKRQIGLTDRQYSLVRTKLLEYNNQFVEKNIDLQRYLDTLRMPLREIDRSHWVKKVEDKIHIRFPFSKKIIDRINDIRKLNPEQHKYDQHTHIFPYTEFYVYNVVQIAKKFEDKFEIADDVLETYNYLQEMYNNKEQYIPGVYNNVVKNIPDSAIKILKEECGNVEDNLELYFDRRYLFGLHEFDKALVDKRLFNLNPLTQNIIKRTKPNCFISTEKYNPNNLVDTLSELQRYPILVIVKPSDSLHVLPSFFDAVNGIIKNEDQSVLFRLDNTDVGSKEFNQYIKDKKLNNPVAKNTKIVYISSNKVPKPLLVSDFKARMCITFTQFGPTEKSKLYVDNLDLILHFYAEQSMIDYYSKKNVEIV